MKEFQRTSINTNVTMNITDETQSFKLYESSGQTSGQTNNKVQGFIDLPDGASSFTIYRVEYEIDSRIGDGDENHGGYLQVGGTNASSSNMNGVCSNCGGSPIAGFGGYYSNLSSSAAVRTYDVVVSTSNGYTSDQNIYFRGYDNTNGNSGDTWDIRSIKVRVYFFYTYSARPGDIVAGGRIFANSNQSVGDVAEYFPVSEGVEPGLIISFSGEQNKYLLADQPYSQYMVGVISKEPSVVLNDPNEGPPVGLTGRVIVKLVESNNLIKGGDFITSSNQKGLGQKATKPGHVIGYAVSDQKQGEDFVEILLQPGTWFHGSENNNLEKLEDRINELEQILKQEANKK